MELRQLEYFLAVVEEGSFTRAAARLYMVQSSLSASLLGLEKELGTELFIRGRRGAELTDAGRALLDPARAALHDAERARDAVAEVAGLLRGSIRVATVAVPRDLDVFRTIGPFHERHPGVAVSVLHDGARDLLGLVAEGTADFAITPLTHRTTPTLRFDPLLSTPLVLLCPPAHRLAGARDVELGDVVDESLIDLPRGWWVRELFDRMFAEGGLPRRVRLEVDEWFGVLTLVRRGMGIACGPLACIDEVLFGDLAVATLGGAPAWQLASRRGTTRSGELPVVPSWTPTGGSAGSASGADPAHGPPHDPGRP